MKQRLRRKVRLGRRSGVLLALGSAVFKVTKRLRPGTERRDTSGGLMRWHFWRGIWRSGRLRLVRSRYDCRLALCWTRIDADALRCGVSVQTEALYFCE